MAIEKNEEDKNFSIQLLIIGILLPIYLNSLPLVIKPVWKFSFEIIKYISYGFGFLWFSCLILGTYHIARCDDWIYINSKEIYKIIFRLISLITIIIFLLLAIVYIISILNIIFGFIWYYIFMIVFFVYLVIIILREVFDTFRKNGKKK